MKGHNVAYLCMIDGMASRELSDGDNYYVTATSSGKYWEKPFSDEWFKAQLKAQLNEDAPIGG